ncbi:hypothetical protein GALMADRAFT_282402 [Galerina marginata CBS 339.88]|uniref:Cytochrome P450 n=1 Tax=Galerina marginata (strain CBS 339.88) TaxID=685588 RepID=A0A067SJ29_GALM3|nr:hypothetical protein GALMADRAFT_282402 [Galerina marginata CBS 339.88]
MTSIDIPIALATAIFLFVLLRRLSSKPTHHPNLPPGPPADPIIGHFRHTRMPHQENVFHDWAKIYGDVICLQFLGRTVVVLDSFEAANELLNKRGSNYSCRLQSAVFELMGWDASLPFLKYGKQFVKHRRFMYQQLNRKQSLSYRSIQLEESRTLVKSLLSNPKAFERHLERFSTSVIMRLAYGHQITSSDDPFLKVIQDFLDTLDGAGITGNTLIDFFPFLQRLPSWFPGTHYANWARSRRWAVRQLYDYPFDLTRNEMSNGDAKHCFLTGLLERSTDAEDVEDIKGAAATLHTAGGETTWAALSVFIMAMVLYPECQRKAHQELDDVIGTDRLPNFSDQSVLPYIECVVQEALRWKPVVILGVPHVSLEDDVYKGMLIPKGSIVIANAGGMRFDEGVYAEPRIFNPDRFLPKPHGNAEPPFDAAFGFGRRICPGRHVAEASLWIAIASMLASFDFCKAVGEDGKEITPDPFVGGLARHAKPFPCVIRPRFGKEALTACISTSH